MQAIPHGVKPNLGTVDTQMTSRERTLSLGAEDRGPAEQQPGTNLGATEIAAQQVVLNISQPSASVLQAKFEDAMKAINAFDIMCNPGEAINMEVFSPDLVDFRDQFKQTLMHYAICKCNKAVVERLIGHGYSLAEKIMKVKTH